MMLKQGSDGHNCLGSEVRAFRVQHLQQPPQTRVHQGRNLQRDVRHSLHAAVDEILPPVPPEVHLELPHDSSRIPLIRQHLNQLQLHLLGGMRVVRPDPERREVRPQQIRAAGRKGQALAQGQQGDLGGGAADHPHKVSTQLLLHLHRGLQLDQRRGGRQHHGVGRSPEQGLQALQDQLEVPRGGSVRGRRAEASSVPCH
mmetsp:Transcript_88588/g.236815  ORF Transcript_88588/g.236815 Transcript_88588/m.236815 type:complete len:200 (+) Transcript_88588:1056-1655(+)